MKHIFILFIGFTVASNIIAMQLANPHNHHKKDIVAFHSPLMELPPETLDKILAYCTHKSRGHLKNSCEKLSKAVSITRLSAMGIHAFNMGDYKEKKAFFTTIIKTNNPQYVTELLTYAKKEAHQLNNIPSDAITITLVDDVIMEKDHLQKEYLPILFKEAIKRNKSAVMQPLIDEGAYVIFNYQDSPLHYAAQLDSDVALQVLINNNFTPSVLNEKNETVLEVAMAHNSHKVISILNQDDITAQNIAILKRRQISRLCSVVIVFGAFAGTCIIIGGFSTFIAGAATCWFGSNNPTCPPNDSTYQDGNSTDMYNYTNNTIKNHHHHNHTNSSWF